MSNYLFIDDSGSKHWDTPYAAEFVDHPPARTPQNYKFWRDNYLVLGGIHTDTETMRRLNKEVDKKKVEVFGTKYVELHASDLRYNLKRRKKYLEPFGITEEELRDFIINFWYPLFEKYNLQSIAVIVDKRYYSNPRHEKTPLDIVAEGLFDQTELHPHRDCSIIFDQMDKQVKTEKRDQGKILKLARTKINLEDGRFADKYHHTSVGFEKSINSNFLQLADAVAYNTWRQFVDYGDEWEKHLDEVHRQLPTYEYFAKIADSFYHRSEDGRVSGIGIVKLPDPNNRERGWNIEK